MATYFSTGRPPKVEDQLAMRLIEIEIRLREAWARLRGWFQ